MIRAYSAYGLDGASTRVRLVDWFKHLEISAEHHRYLGLASNSSGALVRMPIKVAAAEARLRGQARSDFGGVSIISREATPLGNGTVEVGLLSRSRHAVYDIDDAIYLSAAGLRGRLFDQTSKFNRIASAADVVIVGNDVLAEYAGPRCRDVRIIPSCVEPSRYLRKHTYELRDSPQLVWVGSRSTERYVHEIASSLAEVVRRTGARLTIVSHPLSDPGGLDRYPWIRRVPWSWETMVREMAASDLAIAPLPDDDFARGKCAYKLLQYAAAGVPIVGSPVGANARALRLFDGWPVEQSSDWVSAVLEALAESPSARQRRGVTSALAVSDHYSFSRWEREWRRAAGVDDDKTGGS